MNKRNIGSIISILGFLSGTIGVALLGNLLTWQASIGLSFISCLVMFGGWAIIIFGDSNEKKT